MSDLCGSRTWECAAQTHGHKNSAEPGTVKKKTIFGQLFLTQKVLLGAEEMGIALANLLNRNQLR
jgi:hypothetical protein